MSQNKTIRLKAAFLLVIFGLNTVIGFACSIGIDMGYNKTHHGTDGKRHIHKAKTAGHHHENKTTASKKDDCCKSNVVKLQKSDKNFQYGKTTVQAPFYLLPKNTLQVVAPKTVDPGLQEYIACHFHPPPRDIRIAIQSFQI
jgi:hypothetical protein